jgi:anti-sigma factor RsiW
MSCSKFHKRLWKYVAGELPGDQTAEIEQHLRLCARCQEALDQIRLLAAASRDLAETKLKRDLWPEIQRRVLTPEPTGTRHRRPAPLSGWRPRLAWAFGLASLLLILFIARHEFRSPGPQAPPVTAQARRLEDARSDIELARQHYERSAQALEAIVAHRSHDIDLDQARLYQDKLQQLETVIAECSQALEHNKYDVRAQQTLFNAYDQKISTLREMAVVASY